MLNVDKFNFDIINLKKDLAMEDMIVTDADIALLKRYSQNEITMDDMINIIKEEI